MDSNNLRNRSLERKFVVVTGRRFHVVGIAAFILFSSFFSVSCGAMSRIGKAHVEEVDGQPCFSISKTAESSQARIQLFTLSISEPERESWRALPKELWSFLIDPPGQWIETTPDICIRYGDVPHSAKVRHEAKPLQPNHVYIVFIGARPVSDSTATLGYEAAFCLKLSKDGNNTIEMVPWDKNAQRWHHEVCTP